MDNKIPIIRRQGRDYPLATSSDTNCPSGCCGRFAHTKDYSLATDTEDIKEAFWHEKLP